MRRAWRDIPSRRTPTRSVTTSLILALVVVIFWIFPRNRNFPSTISFSSDPDRIFSSGVKMSSDPGSAPVTSIFSLLVTLVFTAEEYKQQFLQLIAPLAHYVLEHEPETVAYTVICSDTNPLQVMVLERYKDKENAYLKIHKSSGPFLAFRPQLQALQEAGHVTVTGQSYLDTGIGFDTRKSA